MHTQSKFNDAFEMSELPIVKNNKDILVNTDEKKDEDIIEKYMSSRKINNITLLSGIATTVILIVFLNSIEVIYSKLNWDMLQCISSISYKNDTLYK